MENFRSARGPGITQAKLRRATSWRRGVVLGTVNPHNSIHCPYLLLRLPVLVPCTACCAATEPSVCGEAGTIRHSGRPYKIRDRNPPPQREHDTKPEIEPRRTQAGSTLQNPETKATIVDRGNFRETSCGANRGSFFRGGWWRRNFRR